MQFDKLPANVVHALRERGHDENSVRSMSAREVFDQWLNWEGIINYTGSIVVAWDAIKSAERRPCAIREKAKGLFTVYGPHDANWDDVTPKMKATDYMHMAGAIGLSTNELGQLIAILGTTDWRVMANRYHWIALD